MRVQLELPGMPEPDESLIFQSPDTNPPEGEATVVPYGDRWLARYNDEGFCPAFLWETKELAVAWNEYLQQNEPIGQQSPERQMQHMSFLVSGQRRSAHWHEERQRYELENQSDEEIFSLFNSAFRMVGEIRDTA